MTELDSRTAVSPWPADLLSRWGVVGREAPADIPLLATHLRVEEALATYLVSLYGPLAERLARCLPPRQAPLVLGINGAQGTGKSTAAEVIAHLLELRGFRVCRLSIDDLYLTREQRVGLAAEIHPLLVTRGVPGTHDIALGEQVLEELTQANANSRIALPRFDKARDDRAPQPEWWEGRPHLIILEGWCVGARPQLPEELINPINTLEQSEDPNGRWRTYVNEQLIAYQTLFHRLDHLILLEAPSFEQVYQWRSEQESALKCRLEEEGITGTQLMSASQLQHFIDHYERLTRWILQEMPERADLVLALNRDHRVERITALGETRL